MSEAEAWDQRYPDYLEYNQWRYVPQGRLAVGSTAVFQYLIDFEVVREVEFSYYASEYGFYAEYLGGPTPESGLGSWTHPWGWEAVASSGYTWGYLGAPSNVSDHITQEWDMGFRVVYGGKPFADFVVGDRVSARDHFFTGWSQRIVYDLELANISCVPEPGSMLLLGTGLVGLRAWRKPRW